MKPLTPVVIYRATPPSGTKLSDVDGFTDGGLFGCFREYSEWNITHLNTGVCLMRTATKADARKAMVKLAKVPDMWDQLIDIYRRHSYGHRPLKGTS